VTNKNDLNKLVLEAVTNGYKSTCEGANGECEWDTDENIERDHRVLTEELLDKYSLRGG